MVWKPHVTVSAVAERDGHFLLVEEKVRGKRVFNNPAGHLEPDESFPAAVRREVLEETGYHFEPQWITGVYLWRHPEKPATFLRVNFAGRCNGQDVDPELDEGIIGPHWMTLPDIEALGDRLRSPLVTRCIRDFQRGCKYPLEMLTHLLEGGE